MPTKDVLAAGSWLRLSGLALLIAGTASSRPQVQVMISLAALAMLGYGIGLIDIAIVD